MRKGSGCGVWERDQGKIVGERRNYNHGNRQETRKGASCVAAMW